jgi:hypothetical protein
MKGHPISHSESVKFIFAGKAIVTFLNTKTGNRFTYKVKKSKESDLYFVSIMTNPDVYQYIGILSKDKFIPGKKSKISQDSQSVRVFSFVFSKIVTGNLSTDIEIWHEGKCGRCGRKLTVPSSIENGIGPECLRKLK